MKLVIAMTIAISSLMVSGCVKTNPAKTKVYTPAGTVEYHCPPGQRKKGKCL